MRKASKGELLLNEIDAIIERTNQARASPTTKWIPNGGNDAETTTTQATVVLEDLSKKPRFSVPPPLVSLPDSGIEKSNSIKERAKSFQGESIPTSPTTAPSSSSTTEKTIKGSNSSSISANIQPLDTVLEGKVPAHRKSSFVADAIAAVQNKSQSQSVNLPEQSAPQTGITKAKAWPNVGSGMLRSSSEKANSTETATLPVSLTTLATDDIPTVDEPHIPDIVPAPLPVTISASIAGISTQVPATARSKLAAFLAATSQKQGISQGSASISNINNNDTNVVKATETKVQIPVTEKITIPDPVSEETVPTKPQRKPSVVMNAMAQLQSKGK